MLGKEKLPNSKMTRLDKKRQKYKNRYGIDYDEFMQKQKEKQEKRKLGFKSIKQILSLCKSSHKFLWGCVIVVLIGAAIDILGAYQYVHIIDDVTLEFFDKALYATITYGACIAGTHICWFFWEIFYNYASANINYQIKNNLFSNVLNVSTAKYNDVSSGEIINRITNDSSSFAQTVTALVTDICDFISNIAYVVVAFILSPYLGAIMFCLGLIAYLIRRIYLKRRAILYSARTKLIVDKNTSSVQEAIRGNKDIKNLNLKSLINDQQLSLSLNQKHSSIDQQNQRIIFNRIAWFLSSISRALILIASILLIQKGMVSLGVTLGVLTFVWSGLETFMNLANIIQNVKEASVSSSRMLEILDDELYPKEHFGCQTIDNMRGEIEFKHVEFGYKKDELLFKDLSFKIEAGQCIGIVGKSGQGKSSIINLINKLFDVSGGQILLDGVDIQNLSEDSIRDNVSVVSQSPYIFDLTIRENLELVKPDATFDEIVDACKKAYIYDYIMSLDNKFDSKIGEGGVQLSGGQKQRLAIARALLRKSKILLLDEATSALDNESQEKIKSAINDLKNEKTIIIVAHRHTTVMDCDRILFINNNTVKADGTHKQLMKTCPEYKKLYNSEDSEE